MLNIYIYFFIKLDINILKLYIVIQNETLNN